MMLVGFFESIPDPVEQTKKFLSVASLRKGGKILQDIDLVLNIRPLLLLLPSNPTVDGEACQSPRGRSRGKKVLFTKWAHEFEGAY